MDVNAVHSKVNTQVLINLDLFTNLVVEGERVELDANGYLIDTLWDAQGNITELGKPITGVVD